MPSKAKPVYKGGERMKFIEMLHHKSHFSKTEVERLLQMLKQQCPNSPKIRMDRNKFNDFVHKNFEMTDEMIVDRVFRAFDEDNDGFINELEWVKGLSIFLRGTMEEKMKFCFDVYDMNADGYISREEMFHLLKNSILKPATEEDPDEGIKDLVEITLKKFDYDHDTRVSFDDWTKCVKDDNLLLEALGPCLPNLKTKSSFLELVSDAQHDTGMSISAQQKMKGKVTY
ncbi:calaxin-like [Crassostrea virginica]|uniref:EF-hand calcium-binding domain-containing protein 1-like n=1 Tax=Crassostrea virginica TaxID=6565 RepID=A0A8B8BSX2_CRAVI|nr:EF-hand calcium-binding domain-containing protein 1-like [Crassostrea virginica]